MAVTSANGSDQDRSEQEGNPNAGENITRRKFTQEASRMAFAAGTLLRGFFAGDNKANAQEGKEAKKFPPVIGIDRMGDFIEAYEALKTESEKTDFLCNHIPGPSLFKKLLDSDTDFSPKGKHHQMWLKSKDKPENRVGTWNTLIRLYKTNTPVKPTKPNKDEATVNKDETTEQPRETNPQTPEGNDEWTAEDLENFAEMMIPFGANTVWALLSGIWRIQRLRQQANALKGVKREPTGANKINRVEPIPVQYFLDQPYSPQLEYEVQEKERYLQEKLEHLRTAKTANGGLDVAHLMSLLLLQLPTIGASGYVGYKRSGTEGALRAGGGASAATAMSIVGRMPTLAIVARYLKRETGLKEEAQKLIDGHHDLEKGVKKLAADVAIIRDDCDYKRAAYQATPHVPNQVESTEQEGSVVVEDQSDPFSGVSDSEDGVHRDVNGEEYQEGEFDLSVDIDYDDDDSDSEFDEDGNVK